jgi:hypothetical protein
VRDGFGFLATRYRVDRCKKDLTRRANQLHIFIIATSLSPRREIGGGLFLLDGRRIRDAKSYRRGGPSLNACLDRRYRSSQQVRRDPREILKAHSRSRLANMAAA